MHQTLPSDFINQVKELEFFDLDSYLESFNQEIISIRLNPKKSKNIKPEFEKIPWTESAFYLEKRPEFILDPLWHSGNYYVQEAGSMFVEEVLKQLNLLQKDITALDLAAAPGGKSTHLLSLISENSVLISNEILPKRAKILEENLIRWGYDNFILTNNSSDDFKNFGNIFDLIILDAPCSGEGMFRKDHNSISEWSLENVNQCVERQEQILNNIKYLLKYDAYLIYSTCTFNKKENEDLIEKFAIQNNFELVDIDISEFPTLIKNNHTIRAIPGVAKSEGFTISVLKNKNKNNYESKNKQKSKLNVCSNPFPKLFSAKKSHKFYEIQDNIYLFNPKFENILNKCLSELKTITFGNKIAYYKKSERNKIFIPDHNISSAINIEKNNMLELDDIATLKFLKGEALNFENVKNDFYFLTYNEAEIGIAKIANGRANNLFPDNFRIKKMVNYNEPIKSLF